MKNLSFIDGFVKSCLFRHGGIFAETKSVSTLADRRREKGVSSLQEPLRASISARKPAFPHRRQGNEVRFRKSAEKNFPGNRFPRSVFTKDFQGSPRSG
ncbi:MAG: hypothetical protein ACLFUY_03325, partial [Desulfobacterales bacterium]